MNIRVRKHVYRDQHNALVSGRLLQIGGELVKPRITGKVWRYRTWNDGKSRYSPVSSLTEIDGVTYRIGDRIAKPLELEDGENIEPVTFHPGMAFCVDAEHPIDGER